MTRGLDLDGLTRAVAGEAVALRARTRLQPAGGTGDKTFPPTYADPDRYAMELRRRDGADVPCVLLDSVASQANRIEEALLRAWEERDLPFPVIAVDFAGADPELADLGRVSTLQAPHRIADAILRDSVTKDGGVRFRETVEGRAFVAARPSSATALFQLCPTALVFGVWDSTGAAGGLGAKFQRIITSEIVGYGAIKGSKTASRIDPLAIERDVAVYQLAAAPDDWTLDAAEAVQEKNKPKPYGSKGEKAGKPSSINHGNVAPSIDRAAGGVTLDYAEHVAVISLAALRKLRFPPAPGGEATGRDAAGAAAEVAARTALASLAVAGLVLAREQGYDLRSRCVLVPDPPGPLAVELVAGDGSSKGTTVLTADAAIELLRSAAARAAEHGFVWQREPLALVPAPKLVDLVKRSRASASADEGD